MKRAVLTTVVTVPIHDKGKMVGERQGTITTILDGDKTLNDLESFLAKHKTNTTVITFETPIATGPKVVQ